MQHTLTETVRAARAGEISLLLSDLSNPESLRQVLELAYPELHDVAVHHVRNESPGCTLQPTELVNAVVIGFIEAKTVFKNRRYFFGAVSEAMRRVLVDRARRVRAKKRGGHWQRVDFCEAERIGFEQPGELLDLHAALKRLEEVQPLWNEIAELRVFGGLSTAEAATVLGIGASTARKRWANAREWLRGALERPINDAVTGGKKRHDKAVQ